ncbi:unnamed protein product [Adineta steineri]|uniref:Aminopeptidase n=1 Tax=Adineta steineri TaxID=433720 RepID=A0A813TXQ5_9BILA|nr:unnamed protein product [Adineta steineri]CAF3489593.1 unnamed protein product [Adineta steineri]
MTGQTNQETKPLFERLPQTIVPTHYDVTIQPHLDKFKFNGDVNIHLKIKEPTDKVVLYADELEVDHAKIKSSSNDEQKATIDYDKEGERITISFDKKLEKGDYQLLLKFAGDINNRMRGFYRTKYTVPDSDEIRYGASTQFEPADCRRAFPCWDEPNFKATFDITLITPKNLRAISNMPVKSENEYADNKEWKVTKFDRTPIMSTYLVAFVIGEYDYLETNDSNGVSMKVYTPVGKKEHGQFALDTAAKVLPFYADYFNIKYPIAKADQIAIADFAMGAMENWGLITYRETALLIDPKFSSMDTRQRVAIVVAHELAHQWFGNLVTMDWWTDLWLNEGFATWIEYLAVDKCYPEFDIWTQFVADTFARFLVPDALKSSHPIEVPIGHPAEIDEIFDAISYSKGSSVIRMLHDYIGDDAFRKGLHNYLTEYSYKNTVTENLWSHLAKASGKPVNEVMSSWTLQMGYPLLTVVEEQVDKKRVIQITQKRFIADGSVDEEKLQWKIPITVFTKSNPKKIAHQVLMDKPEITITLDNVAEDEWIKFNFNSIGLYRVKYESKTLARLSEPIANKTISPQDRLMVQNDVAALCNAGHQPFVDYLKLLPSYKDEDNFTVWKSIASNIGDLSSLLEYTNYFDEFKRYRLNIFSSIQKKLGWDANPNEDPLSAMLRPMILSIIGKSGKQDVIDEAKKRFERHIAGDLIDPNIRGAVYVIVSRYGDEKTQEELRKLYTAADMTEEKVRLLRAMGQSIKPEIIENTLKFIFEGDNVRMQDSISGLVGCTSSRDGRDLVWKFLQKNWKTLAERFGEKSNFLIAFVEYGLSDFADEKIATEIKTFFDSVNTPIVARPVKKVLETIHMRSEVLKRDSKAIEEFLKQQQ